MSRRNRLPRLSSASAFLLALLLLTGAAQTVSVRAAADLYMKDTPADTGMEPNPDLGAMYVTEDIWIRQNPISGYQPYPYGADPSWLTAISPLHQNPEYRDPKYSKPNYVYVRVRNRGSTPSAGTERLRVYWAKASTGLSWPSQWVDYLAANCGPTKLYGMEITKPRRNLADTTVPQSEVDEYRNAIAAVGTLAGFQFPDGVSYWHKQQAVHSHVVGFTDPSFAAHGNDGFLPWHREFLSRYEILLREAYPRVTLFYWDWTTNPSLSPRITGAMGTFSGGAVGAPFNVLFPPTISRFIGTAPTAPTPTATTDATVTSSVTFSGHSSANETPHNRSHVFVGGSGGTMTSPSTSTRDPFFFLLHGNADRLGAMWQRKNTSRVDPATAYSGTLATMTEPMAPWNGLRYNGSTAAVGNPVNGISPWTAADGYITLKRADDHSVVFPPIYDTAPLTIPILQAGESVVIEIPWYPPNPADFSCFGADQGHVCLLARIETSTTPPFGMTIPEFTTINPNVRNNNNIVWKNVTVQDLWPGPLMLAPVWLRNTDLREIAVTRLELRLPAGSEDIFRFGGVYLDLKPELYARWLQNGAVGQGIERVGGSRLQIFGQGAFIGNLPLQPDESAQVEVQFRLLPNYEDPKGRTLNVDLDQYVAIAGKPEERVGGERFTFDFNRLCLVPRHSAWRYVDDGRFPGEGWPKLETDDAGWKEGRAPLGYGDDVATMIGDGKPTHPITTWFRRSFSLTDPALYRNLWLRLRADDGAVVYLNGTEIYRLRLPAGAAITPTTPATSEVEGVAEELYVAVQISNALPLLQRGLNVLAVEVHQRSADSDDAIFDAELCANIGEPQFPPIVRFLPPVVDGGLYLSGRAIDLTVDVADPDGRVVAVQYLVGRQLIGGSQQAPYRVTWNNPPLGRTQITAVALDEAGNSGEAYATVQVLSNLPPQVRIVAPSNNTVIASSDRITMTADAFDLGGTIQRVDFYRKEHMHSFDEPIVALGSRTSLPYSVTLANLEAGHHMLFADATDNLGLTSRSGIVMLEVTSGGVRIEIQYMIDHVMITRPVGSNLQEADSPAGPWKDVPNAANPLMVLQLEKAKFYRAYFP